MKAVGYESALPLDDERSLLDLELDAPAPGSRDLLVRVNAISVNPVDVKVRRGVNPPAGQLKVLGWDAVGIVEAVGSQVEHFQPGDRVFYAGAIDRQGTNAELHVVDERIVGKAPSSLSDVEAAALPLTAITAWELLFERLQVARDAGAGSHLLIIGAAGGVGSMLIQLARQLTRLNVIATASRPETRNWCLRMGAHAVIDHSQALGPQLMDLAPRGVDFVASLTHTDAHFDAIVESLKPQGRIAVIDDPAALDVTKLKRKSASLHWELMFTRSLFGTPDMSRQRMLLEEVADLTDEGRLRTTATTDLGVLSAFSLKRAHALVESGKTHGKVVLHGYA